MKVKVPEVVFEGFQVGMGRSYNDGFEDIRNMDITSEPGSMSLNLKLSAMNKPPTVTAVAFTSVAATDVLTVASTSGWYNGMAVTLNTVVTSTGIATGRVYWVGDLSGNTFKLYKNPSLPTAQLADVTGGDGSGTISSYTLSAPLDRTYNDTFTNTIFRPYEFILDDEGKAWWIKNVENGTPALTNNLVYLGNDTLTGTTGRGIVVFNQDLVVFRTTSVDKLDLADIENTAIDFDAGTGWEYAIESISSHSETRRPVLASQDGNLYFASNNDLDVLSTAYVDSAALDLTNDEIIASIGELGSSILIGTKGFKVYPWIPGEVSFDLPIIMPERNTSRIVTANQIAYLFSGNTGRIYWTNGSTVDLYKRIPPHVAGVANPYFTWNDAMSWRNNLYFSLNALDNGGSAQSAEAGVWAIDMESGVLRMAHMLSYGSYAGAATVLLPNIMSEAPVGTGIYVGWSNSGSYGVDYADSTYYTSYSAYAISPLYEVGDNLSKLTLGKAIFSLDRKLASGEGVKLYYRKARSDSWSTAITFDFATQGAKQQWDTKFPITDATSLQLKVELTGSATSPSLRKVRIR